MSSANLYRVAIVGAGSLKGKEVAEMLNERNFPAVDVKLLDDDESLGQLEAMGDEVTLLGRDGGQRITVDDVASWAGTVNYEILCGISKRVPRIYKD